MLLINLYYITAVILSLLVLVAWRFAKYADEQQWWTLRLLISLWQPYVLALWSLYIATTIAYTLYGLRPSNRPNYYSHEQAALVDVLVGLAIGIIFIISIDFAVRTFETRQYLQLRWKAWTGQSRTGISPAMVRYIGNSEDWATLLGWTAGKFQQHPIERLAGSFLGESRGIVEDPTDLLRVRAALDQKGGTLWTPQSQEQLGVYQPIISNQSVSLLWGESLGFQRRCSRGIISVPPNLLKVLPSLDLGFNGQAVCLTYGILARNKGLEPTALICNLAVKNTYRQFEENCLWPHPAKTLRSFYHSEFNRAFSLLGPSYVTAATELALLIADMDPALIAAWLDSQFEHQDLQLNEDVHAMGASEEDLQRLYRGHYAAMLVSLSLYRKDIRIRPEITVFDAVCKSENVKPPLWASSDKIEARRQEELEMYGPTLHGLVDAMI